MMKAEPVADVTRNTHNYFAQGGNELVIGGKLTFLPGAIIEGGGDLFNQSEPAAQIAYIADSEATTIASFSEMDSFAFACCRPTLIIALKSASLMASREMA